MLTRIYGLAFSTKKELDEHIKMREEAEKRDHRTLGKQLEIFTFSDEVGPGLPLWLPKGTVIREELEKWARETERAWEYKHVATPHITKGELYKISGHLPYYKDDLYAPFEIEGEAYYLKPMNCPHTHMIYKSRPRSYRELPLRLAEYGQVYRYERSGTLHGLLRVRGFCQNDAHIYVKPEEAVEEFIRVFKLHRYYYDTLGIKDWWVVLGVRDPKNLRAKYHGDDKMWKEAERLSKQALEKAGVKYEIEEGGAAHYGPKADIYIKSIVGKAYAIGTDQLDLYMPGRFKLTYTDRDGKEKTPYIIHRAPLGSHERMIGFLLEHFAGAFPLWLAPVQVEVIPVSDKFAEYGAKVHDALREAGVRVEMSDANETLGKRIRAAELMKIPYILVVGEKEAANGSVNVRHYKLGQVGEVKLEKIVEKIAQEIREKTL
jgi:threonyl-tRNA synthetase